MKKLEKPQKYLGQIETQCNLEPFLLLLLFVENILNFYIKCIQASFSKKKNVVAKQIQMCELKTS